MTDKLIIDYRKLMRNTIINRNGCSSTVQDHEFSDPFPENEPRYTLSFRSEMVEDVTRLIYQARLTAGLLVEVVTTKPLPLENPRGGEPIITPDSATELVVNVPIDKFQQAIRQVPDLHITLETMRPVPLSENNLDRDDSNVFIS